MHSLLGLPNPFPFLGAAGLMGDPKANKGPSLPAGLPPGFPNMMDIQHTQALINLARNSNFLPPAPPTVSTSSSTPTAPTPFPESKKRPAAAPALQTTEQVLDLSPSMQSTNASSLAKKAKLDLKVSDSTILNWSVSEVCNFVATIDICREYSEVSFFFALVGSGKLPNDKEQVCFPLFLTNSQITCFYRRHSDVFATSKYSNNWMMGSLTLSAHF